MERQAAPGKLELVREFLNSVDLEKQQDQFLSPEALRRWLLERGLLGPSEDLNDVDHRRAVSVRESLRTMLLANNGEPSDLDAIQTLNFAAANARLMVQFSESQPPSLEPGSAGLEGALGSLFGIIYTAMADGSWERLKACRQDTCRWAFYDQSKNHSGTWCTMAVCGNRAKARAYRQRRSDGVRAS